MSAVGVRVRDGQGQGTLFFAHNRVSCFERGTHIKPLVLPATQPSGFEGFSPVPVHAKALDGPVTNCPYPGGLSRNLASVVSDQTDRERHDHLPPASMNSCGSSATSCMVSRMSFSQFMNPSPPRISSGASGMLGCHSDDVICGLRRSARASLDCSPRMNALSASNVWRTISTLSCDIAYYDSPPASRATCLADEGLNTKRALPRADRAADTTRLGALPRRRSMTTHPHAGTDVANTL